MNFGDSSKSINRETGKKSGEEWLFVIRSSHHVKNRKFGQSELRSEKGVALATSRTVVLLRTKTTIAKKRKKNDKTTSEKNPTCHHYHVVHKNRTAKKNDMRKRHAKKKNCVPTLIIIFYISRTLVKQISS